MFILTDTNDGNYGNETQKMKFEKYYIKAANFKYDDFNDVLSPWGVSASKTVTKKLSPSLSVTTSFLCKRIDKKLVPTETNG